MTRRARQRLLRLAVVPLLLTSACALPLSHDVHPVGDVSGGPDQGGPLQVIPPGPRVDDTPAETVLGFLGAQADSDNRHAIARQFLAPEEQDRWRDDTDVQVYEPDRLTVQELPGGTTTRAAVQVVTLVTAGIRADGSYVVRRPQRVVETYGLRRVRGQWLLDAVPDGLRLTAADRRRSFTGFPVYYLAPPLVDSAPHLVPDQVFLPVGDDLATTLVGRLLEKPSQALGTSVRTAVPAGARLREPVSLNGAGVATVDLTGAAFRPADGDAEDLSAQLVWTLRSLGPSFRSLRLLVDGTPLVMPDGSTTEDADAWSAYDPEGLGPKPPYFYVSDRRLRASVDLPSGPPTSGDASSASSVPVDDVAVTPDRARVALVERGKGGVVTVRVGTLRGTSYPVVDAEPGLSSPSWGAGGLGLWMLRDGREVVRLDTGAAAPVVVPVQGLPRGRLDALALSRDGVRVALVVAGRLYVGRLDLSSGSPVVVALTQPNLSLHDVTDVSWATSTQVVVLAAVTPRSQVLRVDVDGSRTVLLDTGGLVATAVAASPAGVLLVAGGRLYLSTGEGFRQAQPDVASSPVYPD